MTSFIPLKSAFNLSVPVLSGLNRYPPQASAASLSSTSPRCCSAFASPSGRSAFAWSGDSALIVAFSGVDVEAVDVGALSRCVERSHCAIPLIRLDSLRLSPRQHRFQGMVEVGNWESMADGTACLTNAMQPAHRQTLRHATFTARAAFVWYKHPRAPSLKLV